MNLVREMLLIDEPSVMRLYEELVKICVYFIPAMFLLALVLEFFGDMKFGEVVKRLLIITLFLGSFYSIHSKAVDMSMDTAYQTLKKVSPNNIFIRKWYKVRVETKNKEDWGWLKTFAVPNLNDLVATTLFVITKVCIWLLQLIYSTVYHFTYLFAGFTAILYFFKWTDKGLVGTVQSTLWCIAMPFVLIAVLAMVGNTLSSVGSDGGSVKTIVWLLGVTMILLITPVITWGMVKGAGIASSGSKMGQMSVLGVFTMAKTMPFIKKTYSRMKHSTGGRIARSATRSGYEAAKSIVLSKMVSNSSSTSRPWSNSYNGGRK